MAEAQKPIKTRAAETEEEMGHAARLGRREQNNNREKAQEQN